MLAALGKANKQDFLASQPGAIYVGHDKWTLPNGYSLIVTAIYYLCTMREGHRKLASTILEVVLFTGLHTGERIASKLKKIMTDFGIEKKVMGIVSDNASNCKSAIEQLGTFGRLDRKRTFLCCWAHIINLILCSIFDAFGLKAYRGGDTVSTEPDPEPEKNAPKLVLKPAEEEEQEQYILTHLDDKEDKEDTLRKLTRNFDAVNTGICAADGPLAAGYQSEVNPDPFAFWRRGQDSDASTTSKVHNALAKVRDISTRIRVFTQQGNRFCATCKEEGVEGPYTIPSVSKTRWYLVHNQWVSIIRLCPDIKRWQAAEGHDRDATLNKNEITLFRDLVKVTKPLYDLTHTFSSLSSPQIGFVLKAINTIFSAFTTMLEDKQSNNLLFYATAVLLHPSKQQKYLELEEWEALWITNACAKALDYFRKWYSGPEYANAAA
ncbi:hypothetical protein JCM3774_004760 [Rhodotorula dairenensis]